MLRLSWLIAVAALTGCGGSHSAAEAPTGAPEQPRNGDAPPPVPTPDPTADGGTEVARESREAAWERFMKAWNERDAVALRTFTPAAGLLVLDNPGALVRFRKLDGPAKLLSLEGEFDAARLKKVQLAAVSASEAPPPESCEVEVTESGTHWTEPGRAKLELRWKGMAEYFEKDESKELSPAYEAARTGSNFAVYDLTNHAGFLFGTERGHIVLLAVDAVIPCSA